MSLENTLMAGKSSSQGSLFDMFRTDSRVQSRVTWRDELITILMGTWLMIGLFIDGWAHNNLPGLETFFTPWHAIFYSGFVATAGWMSWLVIRNLRAGKRGAAAVPYGYALGLLGLVLFGLGGLGDMIWHIVFGIEKDIQALLSPTHLVIFLGGTLIISSPARAAWTARDGEDAPSFKQIFPVLLSITLTAAFILFMNQYLYGFSRVIPFNRSTGFFRQFSGSVLRDVSSAYTSLSLADILLTTIMYVAPILLLMRRWRLPFGSLTFMVTVIAVLMNAMSFFRMANLMLVPPVVGAVVADLLNVAIRPSTSRIYAFRAFALIIPAAMWLPYFFAGHLEWGIAFSPELWCGITVMAMLAGFGLSIIMVPAPEGK